MGYKNLYINWSSGVSPGPCFNIQQDILFVRFHEVWKQPDLQLELSNHSEIWQAPQQHCCQCASICIYGSYLSVHSAADAPGCRRFDYFLTASVLLFSFGPGIWCQLITAHCHFVKEYTGNAWVEDTWKENHIKWTYVYNKWKHSIVYLVVNLKPYLLQYHSHYAWCIWKVYIILIYLIKISHVSCI